MTRKTKLKFTGKQLKTLSKICSRDSAKPAIGHIALRPSGDLTVTDGRMLLSIEHSLEIESTKFIDPDDLKKVAASDKVDLRPENVQVTPKKGNQYSIDYVTDVGDFPKIGPVIPDEWHNLETSKELADKLRLLDQYLENRVMGTIPEETEEKLSESVRSTLDKVPYKNTNNPYYKTPVVNAEYMAKSFQVLESLKPTKAELAEQKGGSWCPDTVAVEIRTYGAVDAVSMPFCVGDNGDGFCGLILIMPTRWDFEGRKRLLFRPRDEA